MIDLINFEKTARTKLEDAIFLASFDRYEGASYLCGFAVEIAFKIKIAKFHNEAYFPETSSEFKNFIVQKIKTHSIDVLERAHPYVFVSINNNAILKARLLSFKSNWSVDNRYKRNFTNNRDCFELIETVEQLVKHLLG